LAYFSFFEKTLPIIPEINPPIPLPSLDTFYGAAAIFYFAKTAPFPLEEEDFIIIAHFEIGS
jgi:hypothetical protein